MKEYQQRRIPAVGTARYAISITNTGKKNRELSKES